MQIHPLFLLRKAARPLQGSIDFNGLQVSIETGRSRARAWYNPQDGSNGMSLMRLPYGYIKGTLGVDGDHVDCFVGPDREAKEVYVVHTTKAPDFKEYDEDKCFLGLNSAEDAKREFFHAYNDPRFFGSMSVWPFEEFKAKVMTTRENPQMLKRAEAHHCVKKLCPDCGSVSTCRCRTPKTETVSEQCWSCKEKSNPELMKSGEALCKQLGDSLGINWKKYDLDEFCDGMFEEQEHKDVVDGDDRKIARIVLEHLDEDPRYYSHLKRAKDMRILKARSGIFY